jgi:acyl-coenzyme A thioesterase PaaI-like protein
VPAVSAEELAELIRDGVPLVGGMGVMVETVGEGTVRLRLLYRVEFVRPGGTVTGPALFALADVALYGAVLSAA